MSVKLQVLIHDGQRKSTEENLISLSQPRPRSAFVKLFIVLHINQASADIQYKKLTFCICSITASTKLIISYY